MAHLVALAKVQNVLFARVNRTLIVALETHFGPRQISSDELACVKYCQKEWPDESVDRVVTNLIRKRGLN